MLVCKYSRDFWSYLAISCMDEVMLDDLARIPTSGATKPTSAQTPRDIRRSRLPANSCLLSPLHLCDWPIALISRPIERLVVMHDCERSQDHENRAGHRGFCGVYACSRNMQVADAHSAAVQMRQSHTHERNSAGGGS